MTLTAPTPTLADAAPTALSLIAGYVGHRTVAIGLRRGLIRRLADRPGSSAGALAEDLGLDPFYVSVWCRAAVGAGVVERDGDGFRLVPHMDTLLLDSSSPAYVGGVFTLMELPRCSAGSSRCSPPGSGSGGTTPAPSGSRRWRAPARPSTPGWSRAAWCRYRAWP